jgi:hypothetical protein
VSNARTGFLDGLRAYERAARSADLHHNPLDRPANETARLFRNGLAVVGFALLEEFLRSRTAEVLRRVSGCGLPFTELPEQLQIAGTVDVASALKFQVDLRRRAGEDVTSLVMDAGRALASVGGPNYELSELAFGRGRPNVGHDDVKDILRAFNVKDAWGQTTRIAKRANCPVLSTLDDFRSVATRRHEAAHLGGHDTALGDLRDYPVQALAIAIGFDALLSRAAFLLVTMDRSFAAGTYDLSDGAIPLRFVEHSGGWFRDVGEGKSRASQRDRSFATVWQGGINRARRNGAVVVGRHNQTPVAWEVTDLGPSRP